MTTVPLSEFQAAAARVAPFIAATPLLPGHHLVGATPHSVAPHLDALYFKCESFQHTGSFKFRGATNAVRSALEEAAREHTGDQGPIAFRFVTHSSGNHGQALAKAAADAGHACTVVCPNNAPRVKIAAMTHYGATLVMCEPTQAAREATCQAVLAEERAKGTHCVLVPPFDDDRVIAGQGTLGVALDKELPLDVDAVIVPVGGGGLISGVATALKGLRPHIKIFGAEPVGADDAARSFATKTVQPHRDGAPNTMADGLRTCLSERTLRHIVANVDDIITTKEVEMKAAMRFAFERAKIVIEPSATVGVAVALFHGERLQGCRKVAVVICGGNVDLDHLTEYMS